MKMFIALALGALACTAALADKPVKDATGTSFNTCTTTSGSTEIPCHQVKDASNTTINPATKENQASELTKLDTLHSDLVAATPAGEQHIGTVAGTTIIAPGTAFTTTSAGGARTVGQLIADNATAASVTKISFTACRIAGGTGMIRLARVKVASDTGFAGQTVILKLYRDAPTLTNGDRGAWLTTESNYIGSIPVKLAQHFSDFEKGKGVPLDDSGNPTEINYDCAAGTTTLTGLLVAGTAFTDQAGSKAVAVVLEGLVN